MQSEGQIAKRETGTVMVLLKRRDDLCLARIRGQRICRWWLLLLVFVRVSDNTGDEAREPDEQDEALSGPGSCAEEDEHLL